MTRTSSTCARLLGLSFCVLSMASYESYGGYRWKLFLRQTGGSTFQSAEAWKRFNADRPMDENFSILDEIEECRHWGVFTFRMSWPRGSVSNIGTPINNIWSQTSNPLEGGPVVTGFQPIKEECTHALPFLGLTNGASQDNEFSLLCNVCTGGSWWFALGSSTLGPCGAPNSE